MYVFKILILFWSHCLFNVYVDCCLPTQGIECFFIVNNAIVYTGTKNTTIAGETCQRWDRQSPHQHLQTGAEFPEQSLAAAENFCRDPDDNGFPWCYCTNTNHRWRTCGVPLCPVLNDSTTTTTTYTRTTTSNTAPITKPRTTPSATPSQEKLKEEIIKKLKVDKTKLSITVRKKTSAPDERRSSTSIGYTATIVMSVPFVLIIIADMETIIRYLLNTNHN